MAVPDKVVHDMDTTETPDEAGGYVDLTEKGPERPITIRHSEQNEEDPITIDDESQHKKLAKKITVDNDSMVNHPPGPVYTCSSASFSNLTTNKICTASENDIDTYLHHTGKRKHRHVHFQGVPDYPSHGKVKKNKRYKSLEAVRKAVPKEVTVEGKIYELELNFKLKTSNQSISNTNQREKNILSAGTIDRPPDRRNATVVNCPEPLDLTCKQPYLPDSEPLDLRKEITSTSQLKHASKLYSDQDGREPVLPCLDTGIQSPADVELVPTTYQVPTESKEDSSSMDVCGNMPNLSTLTLANNTSSVGQSASKKPVHDVNITQEQYNQLWLYLQQKALKDSLAQHGQHRQDGVPPGVSAGTPRSVTDADNSIQMPNLSNLGLADNSGGIYVSHHEKVLQGLRAKFNRR